jgi:hypothetical protein
VEQLVQEQLACLGRLVLMVAMGGLVGQSLEAMGGLVEQQLVAYRPLELLALGALVGLGSQYRAHLVEQLVQEQLAYLVQLELVLGIQVLAAMDGSTLAIVAEVLQGRWGVQGLVIRFPECLVE